MSQTVGCPQGFEKGVFFTCHAICPPRFKHQQDEGGAGPPVSKCVHIHHNQIFFNLTSLPQIEPTEEIPQSYSSEMDRIEEELTRVDGELEDLVELNEASRQRRRYVREFSRIDSKYTDFKDASAAINKLKEVSDTLKPMRAATAPSSDLEKERKAILSIETRDLFFIQFSLFLLVLVFLAYFTLPTDTAHVLAFLLLSVGVSIGFFLTR